MGEVSDGCLCVIHSHGNACSVKVVNGVPHFRIAVVRIEDELQLARARDLDVGCTVLIRMGVPADDNRLLPSGYQPAKIVKTLEL